MKFVQFAAVSAVVLLVGMGAASAQMAKPTETKGVKVDLLTSYDLGKEGLTDYTSRQYQMRKIVFAPGGVFMYHSHADRPGAAYLVSGRLVEHRDGAPDRIWKAGDVIVESTDVKQ
jgi:quercetin dioxygenase-like cupin family protein